MAITSVGFKGTVGQVEDARRWGRMGPRFAVGGPTDLLVTPGSGDRTVSVAAGTAQAGAVLATNSGATPVTLPANNGSQTRYDLILLRWTWTDPIVQPVLTYRQGITGATSPDVAGLIRTLGTQYDGVLAVVKVAPGQGTLSANDIFNCQVWGGAAGALVAAQAAYLLAVVDANVGDELVVQSGTPVKRYRRESTGWVGVRASGLAIVTPDANGVMIIAHQLGRQPTTWGLVAGQQATLLLNLVGDVRAGNADAANIVGRFVRTDTSAPLDSLCVAHWWAE